MFAFHNVLLAVDECLLWSFKILPRIEDNVKYHKTKHKYEKHFS